MDFSIFRAMQPSHLILADSHYSQKKFYTLAVIPYFSHSLPHPPPVNDESFSTDLPILDISHRWNHVIFGLLCPAPFT